MLNGKRMVAVLLALLLSVTTLASCTDKGEDGGEGSVATYTVTFDSNGGSAVEPMQVTAGSLCGEPEVPTREGYIFGGWTYNNNLTWYFDSETVREDVTLKASWIAAESVFAYERAEDGTAVITELKTQRMTIHVPSVIGGYTVSTIGPEVFTGVTTEEVSEIILPESVTRIGDGAFEAVAEIDIIVEGALTEIGERAFFDCDRLTEITLGEGLTRIAADAFSGCVSLKNLSLPKSVSVIEENAFEGCTGLQTVILHSDITAVEDSAFDDCDDLMTLYFYGEETAVDALLEENTAPMNDPFLDAKIYLYSESEPAKETVYDGYWYLEDNSRLRVW